MSKSAHETRVLWNIWAVIYLHLPERLSMKRTCLPDKTINSTEWKRTKRKRRRSRGTCSTQQNERVRESKFKIWNQNERVKLDVFTKRILISFPNNTCLQCISVRQLKREKKKRIIKWSERTTTAATKKRSHLSEVLLSNGILARFFIHLPHLLRMSDAFFQWRNTKKKNENIDNNTKNVQSKRRRA